MFTPADLVILIVTLMVPFFGVGMFVVVMTVIKSIFSFLEEDH